MWVSGEMTTGLHTALFLQHWTLFYTETLPNTERYFFKLFEFILERAVIENSFTAALKRLQFYSRRCTQSVLCILLINYWPLQIFRHTWKWAKWNEFLATNQRSLKSARQPMSSALHREHQYTPKLWNVCCLLSREQKC